MTSRQYNVPYNPQDWGPVSGAASNVGHATYPQTNSVLRVVSHPRHAAGHSGPYHLILHFIRQFWVLVKSVPTNQCLICTSNRRIVITAAAALLSSKPTTAASTVKRACQS
jgi:hypothetical protein